MYQDNEATGKTGTTGTTSGSTARISAARDGFLVRAMSWWSRRTYGDVLQPGLVMAHNRKVLMTNVRHERSVEKWDALDAELTDLATLAAAATVGCSWCLDFGYWVSRGHGVARDKLEAVTTWRTSSAYTELERQVIAYAEAMSRTPVEVTDEMVGFLVRELGEPAVVELTAVVALESQRSRFNIALGLESQGFKAQCDLRPAGG